MRRKFRCDNKRYFCRVKLSRVPPSEVSEKDIFGRMPSILKPAAMATLATSPFRALTSPAVNDGKGEREIPPAEHPHLSVNRARC
ncbi:hypothetical protein M9458_009527, partial [Cirrhinus mrigala]